MSKRDAPGIASTSDITRAPRYNRICNHDTRVCHALGIQGPKGSHGTMRNRIWFHILRKILRYSIYRKYFFNPNANDSKYGIKSSTKNWFLYVYFIDRISHQILWNSLSILYRSNFIVKFDQSLWNYIKKIAKQTQIRWNLTNFDISYIMW